MAGLHSVLDILTALLEVDSDAVECVEETAYMCGNDLSSIEGWAAMIRQEAEWFVDWGGYLWETPEGYAEKLREVADRIRDKEV